MVSIIRLLQLFIVEGTIGIPTHCPTVHLSVRCNLEPEITKLEDLKVPRRSPDLFNHVKIGKGQLQGILIKHILFYHIWGSQPFWSSDLKQSIKHSIKQPSDF